MTPTKLFATLLTLGSLAVASSAMASGFALFTQSASGLGKANSATAMHDDPSALFFNPALMSELEGTRIEAGTTLIAPKRSFDSSVTGTSSDAEEQIFFPSTLYFSHEMSDSLDLGMAVYSPFGLATDWGPNWEGRYLATKSELTTFNLNPSLAWQPTGFLTLAGGIDLILLDTSLERKINSAALGTIMGIPGAAGLGDTNQNFSGDGEGWGYNFGLLAKVGDNISLGAHYRSRVEVEVSGSLNFQTPHPAFDLMLPNTAAETDLTLPAQLSFGAAWQASPELIVEAGARWEEWSSYDRLTLITSKSVLGSNTIVEQKNWDDTWAFNIGADYALDDQWRLMAGYLYGDTPVPDATFEPAVPDSPAHLFTLGAKWKKDKQLSLSFSYGYQVQEDRTKNNLLVDPLSQAPATAANGEYSSSIHLLALSVVYRF